MQSGESGAVEVGDGVSGVLAFAVSRLPPSHRTPERVTLPWVGVQAHRLTVSADEREKPAGGIFPPPDAAADASLATGV